MGDAAMNEETPLPQLAQVARQQGMFLSKVFNGQLKEDEKPFTFLNLGSMASLGEMKGLYDGSKVGLQGGEISVTKSTGLFPFVSTLTFNYR